MDEHVLQVVVDITAGHQIGVARVEDHVEVFEVEGRLPPGWRRAIARAARVSRACWCKDTRTGLWRPRHEVAYYVSQARLDAAGFGRAVRAHWGIENRNHHVRDRVLARTTAASGASPASSPDCARSRSMSCAPAGSAT